MTTEGRLEWQSELDSAMSDLDSRLSHPRRRASDVGPQPSLPQLGQVEITSELLDEIGWRVAQQLRRSHMAPPAPAGEAAPPAVVAAPVVAAPVVVPAPPALPDGVAMVIRLRQPLFTFSWRFWRRHHKRRSFISLSDTRGREGCDPGNLKAHPPQ